MLLSNILRPLAATPENPRFSLNDPQAWDAFLSGEPASSGVRVTRETALTYAPWWRGVNLLSGDVGKVPLVVYRGVGAGKRPDPSHPAYYALRRKANEYMTAFQFKRLLTSHAITTGNGYAYVSRRGDGSLLPPEESGGLLPLNPESTIPAREGGRLLYIVEVGGEKRKVPADNILHVRGFNFDGLMGYSVYDKAREDLGIGIGSRKYGSVFFRNNARPNIAVEVPGRLDERQQQQLREGWERINAGLENAHRLMLLQGGAKLQQFSINARDAQLMELRQFQIVEIANWLGVPPHKLGDSSRTSYNSLEQENQDYLDSGLDPWFVCWEEECWDKLLSEDEKRSDSHHVEFDRDVLVRANLSARASYYRTATGGRAWMTPDEVRGKERMNPLGGDAALLKDPLNMGAGPGPDDANDGPPRGGEAAARAVVEDAARRMVRRLVKAAATAAKRPREFLAWLDGVEAEHGAVVTEAFKAPALVCGPGAFAGEMAAELIAAMREALLDASGRCGPSGLAAAVAARAEELETSLPPALAGRFCGG